jgi:hypothetical protein
MKANRKTDLFPVSRRDRLVGYGLALAIIALDATVALTIFAVMGAL